ncbi:hypothetical protein [Janthinobacterium sp. UMAB-60]|uniref:hypothetical protein n=1 Tax=Janthinobacterium sp. UMAB-60 TaxID=1365365 RepID=UPI001C59FDCD|nr:hypothetical protein [Janthinobacterium sp. UMAB-60]
MNKREKIGLIAAIVLLVALIWLGRLNGLKTSDWASWVQAVGSIVAIFVALWMAQAQQRKAAGDADDRSVYEQLQKAETLWTLAHWAIGEMKRALDHVETDGAHGTSTFTPGRLDHEREMLERFVTPSDPESAAFSLRIIHALWETRQNFDSMRDGGLRDYFMQITLVHIQECEKQLTLLTHRKGVLKADCAQRGLVDE